MKTRPFLLAIALVAVTACGQGGANAEKSPTVTQTSAVVPSQTPAPSNTPAPKDRLEPTHPPEPTLEPEPTNTIGPTHTPEPTAAPMSTPEGIMYEGNGDMILELNRPAEAAVIHISGNEASKHFTVWSFEDSGERLHKLVDTYDPYAGTHPLDFLEGEYTTRLEIDAVGDWQVELLPHNRISALHVPGTYECHGDDVFFLKGDPDQAHIKGNDQAFDFTIWGYSGERYLLVSTSHPYEGTVDLHKDTIVLVVRAVGPWTIDVTAR